MSWMKRLYHVYENNIAKVGKFESRHDGQRFTLLPISHVTQSAQIEVTLDHEGNFLKATVVPKEEARTIVPATLDSANRAGAKIAAHFLHDRLFYVAGDYVAYGGEERRTAYYSHYLSQLAAWAESDFTHRKVKLIYQYVKKSTLIQDLVDAKVLFVDEAGKLIEKWTSQDDKKYGMKKPEIYKVVTGNSSEAFVRFTILKESKQDVPVWEDKELFELFHNYLSQQMNQSSDVGICYVTGKEAPLTDRHGSRLRNAGDMSKLISSNDSKGFTFRGRFETPDEAVQVGYEVSQKAHNAFRWLNQRQGYRSDTRHFVTFGVKNPEIIQPFQGTLAMYNDPLLSVKSPTVAEGDNEPTQLAMAEQLQHALTCKKQQLDVERQDQIIIMAVDAATTGRLATVYYQELAHSLYLENLLHWHNTCQWLQTYQDRENDKLIRYVGTPSTYYIVEAVYGPNADEKVKKELYTRLLPCIVDKAAIPKDIVRSIFNRVKNPMGFYYEQTNVNTSWQGSMDIACALIRKQYEKEEFSMKLDVNNRNRDYLFGRLLGVAKVLERNELKRRGESRTTSAMRYFNVYSQRPARTWMTIRRQLHPYQVRKGVLSGYYHQLIEEIESTITPGDMNNDELGPLFLLGYSSQVQYLYTKKDKKEASEDHVFK